MSRLATLIAQRTSRFGLGEVLLVAGILAFGGFVLLLEGRLTVESLQAGLDAIVSR
jgi:hypothetical protein